MLSDAGDEAAVASGLSSWLWNPRSLNWWIGILFGVGSLLFTTGCAVSLLPELAKSMSFDSLEINAIFFAGSIPFTAAGYLQLYQAANVQEFCTGVSQERRRPAIIGWRPNDIGWLSSVLQFVGTILFNFNTFDSMLPSLNWFGKDLMVWVPDMIGSTLFLAAGYLAFIETCHAHWSWQPSSISWWVVSINLLGCIGFMIAAIFAIALPASHHEAITLSVAFTLLGAIGFFVGSLLMLPEAVATHDP